MPTQNMLLKSSRRGGRLKVGGTYFIYLTPELLAHAYKLNNKERNAQLDYLNRYAI
ncbi:TPA: hypothetical protein HIB58_000063 [Escherichia coli]|nr:hypothetical protein [Escherichia coli]QRE96322.1 hypothetical protein GUK18_00650 [Escherichia coli O84:H7]WFA95298.1 hypothetical protein GQ584_05760 [Escherichia coli NC101]EFF9488414.1 hypothetical protein [Escherichia coli]EFF9549020.1 hypothetical protein [Escherichia coli]